MDKILISEFVNKFNLTQLNTEINIEKLEIDTMESNRPALQLTGFFEHFDDKRIQIFGTVEHAYLQTQTLEYRREIFEKLCEYQMPCIIFTRSLEIFPELVEIATNHNIPVFSSKDQTTEFIGDMLAWLRRKLASTISRHGVLVDIYGEGVFIMGDSGIGKSETALELIKRGHRLVADDAVHMTRVSDKLLMGTCPELIRHLIELRGIGIIDVKEMFGVESIKKEQPIDLVINLESWDDSREYDRLGLIDTYTDILGVKIPIHNIPVSPGRNVAIICESAALNLRQKKMGYNAAQELNDRIAKSMNKN